MPAFVEQIKEVWNRLPMTGRIATISAAVATIGLLAAVVYYGTQPEYGVLFSDLKPEDAQTIVEKLKASNVSYSVSNGGTTINVPAEKISELRLQMAGAGVLSGGHVGFDLFDKTSFGATDFAQQVNYRRAIEGELAKTLESMDELEAARVHITPKKESVFSEKEEGAKASVMLRVRQGKELSGERTEAIVNLVAGSVEGLDPSNISIMDTRGRLLTSGSKSKTATGGDAGAFNAQLEAKQKFEAETAARIIALLEPVVGEGKVQADISADVDFSQIEQLEEKYNPQSQVVRSQQNSQETRNSSKTNPAGVVGARANDPTAQNPPVPQNQQSGSDQRISTTTNYEIDKTVKKTIGGGGRVNRLTVSVVVDHKNVDGTEVARTTEEVKQIQDLVAAAVGADENRGDSVVVQTMPFEKPQIEQNNSAFSFLEKNKSLINPAIKYGALVLVALLILFFVVRPARKHLKAAMATPEEQNLLTEGEGEAGDENGEKRRLEGDPENAFPELEPMMTVAEMEAQMDGKTLSPDPNETARQIEAVRKTLIEQTIKEPEIVVSTLRSWLREETPQEG
ncbi:MAG: flagellar basal-body MS-ring/collar protein FliF [Pyrinomonadaceae bacterium]